MTAGGGGVGDVRFHVIDSRKPFHVKLLSGDEVKVVPLPAHHGQVHGKPFECLGFRIDSLSYLSDCHHVPLSTSELMAGSQIVVIDALNRELHISNCPLILHADFMLTYHCHSSSIAYRHASHFSLSQALSFILSMPSPAPRLSLLTDLTHNLEHYETERNVQSWRSDLQNWRNEQERQGWKEPSIAKVGRGEGGGARWWNGKWDERASEKRGTPLTLLGDRVQNGTTLQGATGATLPSNTSIPHFHVAWDGMVVTFEEEGSTSAPEKR